METGFDTTLLNLNPDGWIEGVTNERSWRMLYGLDVGVERQLIIAGDSHGCVHFGDARSHALVAHQQIHKKGNKVNSVHVNPTDCNLVMTGSNDWTARLCDIRNLSSSVGPSNAAGEPLPSLPAHAPGMSVAPPCGMCPHCCPVDCAFNCGPQWQCLPR